MKRYVLAIAVVAACPPLDGLAAAAKPAEVKPIRRGWDSFGGAPYNGCTFLEVTGPSTAKALIQKRAKEQYREVDEDALLLVADKVVVRIATVDARACAGQVPVEAIFVDKKLDKPALRVDLKADTTALQNGFGATWTSSDGVGVVPADEFKEALADGKFHVVVVMSDGSTTRIGEGISGTAWSGRHTKEALK